MKKVLIFSFLALLLIVGVLTTKAPTTAEPVEKIYTAQELLSEANKLRTEKGVAPLVIDERLNKSAQWKAQDMVTTGLNHVSSDSTQGFTKIFGFAPSQCKYASENIELNTGNYKSPFDWWISSEPHYNAILDVKYDLTGFGVAQVGDKIYYVQHFCDLK